MKYISNYPAVNEILKTYTEKVTILLGQNLMGVYLFGSLTYGDFDPKSSDIDLMVLVDNPLTQDEIDQVQVLHEELEKTYPEWKHRVEASYTPINMLSEIMPPKNPRPYYGEGKMWNEANYGNEWIINLYLTYTYGQTLIGPEFKTLAEPFEMVEVQKACIRDLFKEWEPKLLEPEWLNNSHYQSYLVLNLCRILHAIINANPVSKKVSAQWMKTTYPQWENLIKTAEDWHYGIEMTKQLETLDFLKFIIKTVKHHELYGQLR